MGSTLLKRNSIFHHKQSAGVKRKKGRLISDLIFMCLKACMFYQLLADQSDQSYSIVSVVVLDYNPRDLWTF